MRKIVLSTLLAASLVTACGRPVTTPNGLSTRQTPVNFYSGLGLASDGTLKRGQSDLFNNQEFSTADRNRDGRLSKVEMDRFFEEQQDPSIPEMTSLDPIELGVIGVGGGILAGYLAFAGNKLSKEILHPVVDRKDPSLTTGTLTVDDIQLSVGYRVAATPTDKAIVLCHAHGFAKESMAEHAAMLAGYNVLLLDFRNHGSTTNALSTGGAAEARDVRAAVGYLKGLGNKQIGVLGVGMGGVAALAAAVEEPGIVGVVADNVYASLAEDLTYRAKKRKFFAASGVAQAAVSIISLRSRMQVTKSDANLSVTSLGTLRPLFIQAQKQPGLSEDTAKSLYQAGAERWFLRMLPGSSSQPSAYGADPAVYKQEITEYFSGVFQP